MTSLADLDAECPLPPKSETWTFTCWTDGDLRTVRAAAYRAGRLAGLEGAAKKCEEQSNYEDFGAYWADEIRALKASNG